MPITAWQAIVGKFLASWLFLGLALALTFPVWITTNYLGSPDNGVIFAGYVGSWLMAGGFLAVCCVASAMTRTQVIAFIIGLVICAVLVLIGFPPVVQFVSANVGPRVADFTSSLSFYTHFEAFKKGILDSRDVIFFVSMIGFSLFTTSVILRSHRAG